MNHPSDTAAPAKVYLNHLGLVCALGDEPHRIKQQLFGTPAAAVKESPLTVTDQYSPGRPLPLGVVERELPALAGSSILEQTRTNRLMAAAMQQLQAAFDETRQGIDPLRIGVILGTSTSGIAEGEAAITRQAASAPGDKPAAASAQRDDKSAPPHDFAYQQQEIANPAITLASWLNIQGPAYVVSTACSSSAKALASARRLLRMGVCDLVIAGGVDSLCQLTVNGFSALESVSEQPCNPFSANRNGINIGEGAALFLVSRQPGPVCLSGVGEGSDAHHISAPHPQGEGAARAMQLALADADLQPRDIDYLNLHGTATAQNDSMESLAVQLVLGTDVPCSSTKPCTGHTLGAAGAIEAAFCWLTLTDHSGQLPVHRWDGHADGDIAPLNLVTQAVRQTEQRRHQPSPPQSQPHHPIRAAMSNSFAFGGNNISLILERTQ
ncbi:beta-ketoacyl-ACP synthase [Aestuariicella hydrocarbonica]|uniref:Beta-ketoacyl-ACP synthase n=1 Tax=Pseudomaricurvus hydrocarbonicus TaxID=1470433 RepID=A0A9E5MGM9_9GAMM|nr:beta-ketoacyl-ACP synthase [Aestuariicella hydrocarbonica]NHO64896.1 beta-ketoacyl-ACP synthase [Aestuariicella hydrocarbonica]